LQQEGPLMRIAQMNFGEKGGLLPLMSKGGCHGT
jgi:hypothetical protein